MKIRYSYSWKEYWQRSAWRRRQIRHREVAHAYVAMAITVVLFTITLLSEEHREPFLVPLVLQIDAKMLLWALPFAVLLTCLVEALGRAVEINREGVIYHRFVDPKRLPWQSITVLDEDDRAIYMAFYHRSFVLSPKAPAFVYIPKRAFSSADEAERFYEQARLYCAEAGGQPRSAAVLTSTQPLAN